MDAIQINKDRILIIDQERHDSEEYRYLKQQKTINKLDYAHYQKDSILKAEIDPRSTKIQKMKEKSIMTRQSDNKPTLCP